MRFGQNILRMAWKARFVQFSWKAYCFHVLALISVPWAIFGSGRLKKCDLVKTSSAWLKKHVLYNFRRKPIVLTYWREFHFPQSDFGIWKVEKCDLAKTSSAWPEKHVLYNFHRKPTVFTYWREFQSRRAIFGSETLRNAIWSKRPPHGLKSTFSTIFMESLLFSRVGVNFSPLSDFLDLEGWKMRFGQNVLRMAWKARFVQFA